MFCASDDFSRELSVKMSKGALADAMLKAYKEGLGVDFALICEGVVKQVHSQVVHCYR